MGRASRQKGSPESDSVGTETHGLWRGERRGAWLVKSSVTVPLGPLAFCTGPRPLALRRSLNWLAWGEGLLK